MLKPVASKHVSVNKHVDGNRQRCIGCGHPLREHRRDGCSVPKCKCIDYTALASPQLSADR